MKSYTDLEQSKKLAKILPLESADTIWDLANPDLPTIRAIPYEDSDYSNKYLNIMPCWSLAALLSVTRNYCTRFELTLRTNKKYNLFAMGDNFVYRGFNEYPDGIDNPIDSCVALIEKSHELKLLKKPLKLR